MISAKKGTFPWFSIVSCKRLPDAIGISHLWRPRPWSRPWWRTMVWELEKHDVSRNLWNNMVEYPLIYVYIYMYRYIYLIRWIYNTLDIYGPWLERYDTYPWDSGSMMFSSMGYWDSGYYRPWLDAFLIVDNIVDQLYSLF